MKTRPLAASVVVLGLALPSAAAAQEQKLPALREQTRLAPQSASASFALGRALRLAGRGDEALPELLRGGSTGEAWRSGTVGRFWLEIERTHAEREDARGALAACKNMPKTAQALEHVCRAEAFLKQNRASEALPEADQALALEPTLYDGHVARGRALSLAGQLPEAIGALESAIASAKERADAHGELARVRFKLGEREAGLALLRTARSLDGDDPVTAFELGEALGPTPEGAEALRAAITIRPRFGAAHALLATAALALGALDEADRASIEALRLEPNSTQAHLARGRVLLAKGQPALALVEAEAARKSSSYSPAAERLSAEALAASGDVEGATEAFLKVYGLDKNDPTPLLHAARLCIDRGRATTARGFLEKATVTFPEHGPAWDLLGDLEVSRGAAPKARIAYEKALAAKGLTDPDATRKKLGALPSP